MRWINLLWYGIAAEKKLNMQVEVPIDKRPDPFPILSNSQTHKTRLVVHSSGDPRFDCDVLDVNDAGSKTDKDADKVTTRRVCSNNCWTNTMCLGFSFQVEESNVAGRVVKENESGICRLGDTGERVNRAAVGNTLVCTNRRCPLNDIATKACRCATPDGTNECLAGDKCMQDGACERRLACRKQGCMLLSYTATAHSACASVCSPNAEEYGKTCSPSCSASELWRGSPSCGCSDDLVWSSATRCEYDKVVDRECFCQADASLSGDEITLQNVCTPNSRCMRSGFCACEFYAKKVYDMKSEQLFCREIAKLAMVACCDEANTVTFSSVPQDGQGVECFDASNLYDASRTCAQSGGKSLCSLAALIGRHEQNFCANSSFSRAWIIPNQKCTLNTVAHGLCYCQDAADICEYGQVCQVGGCIRKCPAKDAHNSQLDFAYCACGVGISLDTDKNGTKATEPATICSLGQTCHANIGVCVGDGFHTLSLGTCFTPPELDQNKVERRCMNDAKVYSMLTRDRCASFCEASYECECRGFVTFISGDSDMPIRCRLIYSPIDLSLLQQDDQCPDEGTLLHPLVGERLCPAENEIMYARCTCGTSLKMCYRGMQCNIERGSCINKCVCGGDTWWGSECTIHNSAQCKSCTHQFLEDGLCKAGPNQPCFSPPIVDEKGVTVGAGVPKTICAFRKRCLVKTHVGMGLECDYQHVPCICEPLLILPAAPGVANVGDDCGGDPNLKCTESVCKVKASEGEQEAESQTPPAGSGCNISMALHECVCVEAKTYWWIYVLSAVTVVLLGVLVYCISCRRKPQNGIRAPTESPKESSYNGSESAYSAEVQQDF